MIILSAVSIAMLTGNSGIITNAQNAKNETVIGEEKEKVEMAYVSAAINKLGDSVNEDDLQKELEITVGKDKTETTNNGDGTLNVEFIDTEHNYNVNKGAVSKVELPIKISIEVSGKNQTVIADSNVVSEVKDNNVPIPYGFYYVDGDKNTGLVISDVPNDDLNNSKGGHQFVWVPVQIEQKIIIKVSSKYDLKSIIINNEEVSCSGKEFTKIIENPRLNGLYSVIAKDIKENNITYSKELRNFYGQDFLDQIKQTINNMNSEDNELKFDTVEELAQVEGMTAEELENIISSEMNMTLKDYCMLAGISVKELNITSDSQIIWWQNKLKNQNEDVYNNIESVEKYGGFYVGRYEMQSKKGIDYKSYNYNMAKTEVGSLFDTSSVKSELISGYGFDRTLNYICQNSKEGYKLATLKYESFLYGKTGDRVEDEYCHISGFTNHWRQLTSEKDNEWDDSYNWRSGGQLWGDKVENGACARGSRRADESTNGYYTGVYRIQLFLK